MKLIEKNKYVWKKVLWHSIHYSLSNRTNEKCLHSWIGLQIRSPTLLHRNLYIDLLKSLIVEIQIAFVKMPAMMAPEVFDSIPSLRPCFFGSPW